MQVCVVKINVRNLCLVHAFSGLFCAQNVFAVVSPPPLDILTLSMPADISHPCWGGNREGSLIPIPNRWTQLPFSSSRPWLSLPFLSLLIFSHLHFLSFPFVPHSILPQIVTYATVSEIRPLIAWNFPLEIAAKPQQLG